MHHSHPNVRFELSDVFRPQSARNHKERGKVSSGNRIVRPWSAHPHSLSHLPSHHFTKKSLTKSHLRSPRKSLQIDRTSESHGNEELLTLINLADKKYSCKDFDSKFDKKRYTTFESWRDGSPHNSDEYDTDIEDEREIETEKSVDPTGLKTYEEECKKLGVVPVGCLMRDLGKRNIRLCHRYLGGLATKSLALAFKNNTVTETLDLADNFLQSEGARYLADMLTQNLFIVNMDLSYNFIQSDGVHAIAHMLEENTTLKTLSLAGNQLKDADAVLFIDALKNNISLTTLDLSRNMFGEKGGEILAAALICSESLTNLDLSWNSINGKGAAAIANALKVNSSLEVLDLSWNGFAISGTNALKVALPMNTTLRVLDLTNNRLTSKAATNLAVGLKKNFGLETLTLNLNPLGDDGVQVVLKAAADHQNLRVLSLEEIGIDKWNFKLINELQDDKHVIVLYGGMGGYQRNSTVASVLKMFVRFARDHHSNLADCFHQRDLNHSGILTTDEFKLCLTEAGFRLTSKQHQMLIDKIDLSNTGSIKYRDLLSGQVFSRWHIK